MKHIALFLFVGIGTLMGCTRPSGEAILSEAELEELPDQESWDAVLRFSEDGRPRLILAAPYAAHFTQGDSSVTRLGPDPERRDSARVRIELFDAGAPSAIIRADRVDYQDRTQQFVAAGAVDADLYQANGTRLTAGRLTYESESGLFTAEETVIVVTQDGRRLESEQLVWDQAGGQLNVAGRFRFTTPGERINGVGLVASEDLSRYSFSQATGELEVEE
ncbi:MAG: hypothetical protein HKN04_04425 [Rhodothermaceae bacterium]|nr:hypothetical protein [Rhodothermaceae bacterium]